MKNTDKITFGFYFGILFLMFLCLSILVFFNEQFLNYYVHILFVSQYKWYTLIVTLLLALLNLKFIVSLVALDSSNKFHIIKYTENGQINISNETIKSLAQKTISEIKGVKDAKIFIKPEGNKVNIMIKAFVIPDVNIPSAVGEIQDKVKAYIEAIVEVPVGDIKVFVIDIATNTKLRLE